jgi:hypothetical protein
MGARCFKGQELVTWVEIRCKEQNLSHRPEINLTGWISSQEGENLSHGAEFCLEGMKLSHRTDIYLKEGCFPSQG